jgi:hypothetical protein
MTVPKDAFRRFQEELAELERKQQAAQKELTDDARLALAKNEFLAIQKRYGLSVADVVAFFPEEEGIQYLQQLIAASEAGAKPRKNSKKPGGTA